MYSQAYQQIADNALHLPLWCVGVYKRKVIRDGREYMYLQYKYRKNKLKYLGRVGTLTQDKLDTLATIDTAQQLQGHNRTLVRGLMEQYGIQIDPALGKILRGLAASSAFDSDYVLIGTHAFDIYRAVLDTQFHDVPPGTEDVDILNASGKSNISETLAAVGLRGKKMSEFDWAEDQFYVDAARRRRLDILVDGARGTHVALEPGLRTISIPNIAYLAGNALQVNLPYDDGLPVRVPQPARFMWHKYWLGTVPRPAAKQEKDLAQAYALDLTFQKRRFLSLESPEEALASLPAEHRELAQAMQAKVARRMG